MGLKAAREKLGISRALIPLKLGFLSGGADFLSLYFVCSVNSIRNISTFS